jgi:hypothetical protein
MKMKVSEFLKLPAEEMTTFLLKKREEALRATQYTCRTPVYAVSICASIFEERVGRYLLLVALEAIERRPRAQAPPGAEENFEKAYQTVFPDALPKDHHRITMEDDMFRMSKERRAWWLQLSEEDRVNFSGQNRKEVLHESGFYNSPYGKWVRTIKSHPGYKRLVEFHSFAEGMLSLSFLLFLWSAVALTLYLLYLLQEVFSGLGWTTWVITLLTGPAPGFITALFAGWITNLHLDDRYKASFMDPILAAVKEHRVDLDAAAKMNFFEFIGPWWRGDFKRP